MLGNKEVGDKVRLYVVGQELRHPEGREGLVRGADEFPTYGPLVAYRNITKGKLGGLRVGDSL